MQTRYPIPFTQQPYCCVPACIQTLIYERNIPLVSQEELAYELGLVVPEKDTFLFNKVRTGKKPAAGWGTQIQDKKYEINKVFSKLNIPLKVTFYKTDSIKSNKDLKNLLSKIQKNDQDALICFDYRILWNLSGRSGHVCVFDRLEDGRVWLVDPEKNVPKYRKVELGQLYKAINIHGDDNICGVWLIEVIT